MGIEKITCRGRDSGRKYGKKQLKLKGIWGNQCGNQVPWTLPEIYKSDPSQDS